MEDEVELHQARKVANIFRYCEDRLESYGDFQPIFLSEIIEDLYRNALEITPNTTPKIYSLLWETCKDLRVPGNSVQAFVRDYPHFQAISYFSDNRQNVLVLSSKIINFLNDKELKFVLGHEIGHFLLQHGSSQPSEKDPEYFVYQRAQEISADRIGLIACSDVDSACRALMKISSGLHDGFLGRSSSEYVRQLERSELRTGERWDLTHPSSVVRAAILFQFADQIDVRNYAEVSSTKIASIDQKLQSKISSWVSPDPNIASMDTRNELEMWRYLERKVSNGVFSKVAQKEFSDRFGEEKLIKVTRLFLDMSTQEVRHHIMARINNIFVRNS